MQEVLTIVGASTRAAAQAARRAGYRVVAGDLFADRDLRSCCNANRVERYPDDLALVCGGSQPGPWMYTGALENHPELVSRMAALRPLMGNGAPTLRAVRDPFQVAEALDSAGLPCPEVRSGEHAPPRDGTWLRKPLRSASGVGVAVWDETACASLISPAYFQQRIAGLPCAAVYVGGDRDARLLGVTEQLIGTDWAGSGGFRYAGSVGPWRLSTSLEQAFVAIGRRLAEQFSIVGLFGVDAVVRDDRPWPVEVNPRYTASIEILDRALGLESISMHVDACSRGTLPSAIPAHRGDIWGKAILYARLTTRVSAEFIAEIEGENAGQEWPPYADLPEPGMEFQPGWPILTLFARAASSSRVIELLRQQAERLEAMLYAGS